MRRNLTDDGFSLVELIIAMFFLALLSLAVLPLLISAVSTSVTNRDYIKATTFANEQLAVLRAGFPLDSAASCTTLTKRETASIASPIPGPKDSKMTATIDVAPCPAGADDYPASIKVTISVHDVNNDVIATLPAHFRAAQK